MAAPFGNTNALKGKLWNDTLRKAIIQDDKNRLWKAAQKLLDDAANGNAWAIRELADRLDGKSIQANTLEGVEDMPIRSIEVKFVSPEPRDVLTLESN